MFTFLWMFGALLLIAGILTLRKKLLKGRDIKEHAENLRETIEIAKDIPKDLTQKTVSKAKEAVDKFTKTQ